MSDVDATAVAKRLCRPELMGKLPARIVDFHVHLFPDRLFDALWNFFSSEYGLDVRYQMYYRECLHYLRNQGVATVVYSNYAHKPELMKGLFKWNAEVLEEFENVYCFSAYHPGDDGALAMAEKILNHSRILGFKLHLMVQQIYPHDERLYPLYEMVMERKKRLLLHVGTGPEGNQFVGLKEFRRVLDRYPELPANIAHMGALEYGDFMDLLDDHPNLLLDTAFVFFQENKNSGGFPLGRDILYKNRHRILYGSDFPNLVLPRDSEIAGLLEYDLPQDFYDAVFFNNAQRLIQQITKGDGNGFSTHGRASII